LRGDLARKIGSKTRNESCRDDIAGLDDERRRRARKPVRRCGSPINGSIDEKKFATLSILSKGFIGG
jgi:hypothetical protein